MGASLRSQMEYRLSFLLQTLAAFVITATEFVGVTILFQRFGRIAGWSLPEMAVLYGMVHISFALADGVSGGFDNFGHLLKSGDFDRLLLRPRSVALQVAGLELQLRRVGR